MGVVNTEAWVIYQAPENSQRHEPAELRRETYSFPDITEEEVLAEPVYGCWEGNMSHALERDPVDVCAQRGEEKVVIGNAGIVRILKTGSAVRSVREGDLCLFAAIGSTDEFGYTIRVVGYDMRNSIGLLAKRIKLHERQVIPLPKDTKYSPKQWAAFSLRYTTAWANWKLAYGCWRLQMPEELCPTPYVWGWGGGVTLAELTLAKLHGCHTAMIASNQERLSLIEQLGVRPIDRRQFSGLNYDEKKYQLDADYRKRYRVSEKVFLQQVKQHTDGRGVSIFIDNIGEPVFRATLKALAREGVLATLGWKKGAELAINRAVECITHHVHVFSHGARYAEGVSSINFAEETGWIPPVRDEVYSWDNIPQLARDFAAEKINDYFPLYAVNPC